MENKLDQEIINAYERFIANVYESMRFVKMGSGKKHEGVFNILEPIIKAHEKELWDKIDKVMSKKKEPGIPDS